MLLGTRGHVAPGPKWRARHLAPLLDGEQLRAGVLAPAQLAALPAVLLRLGVAPRPLLVAAVRRESLAKLSLMSDTQLIGLGAALQHCTHCCADGTANGSASLLLSSGGGGSSAGGGAVAAHAVSRIAAGPGVVATTWQRPGTPEQQWLKVCTRCMYCLLISHQAVIVVVCCCCATI